MPRPSVMRLKSALTAHPARREVLLGLVAFLVFAAVTAVYTWPLGLHLLSLIFGYPGDSTGSIALFSYRQEMGVGPLSTATTVLENFPFGLQLPGATALPQIAIEGPAQAVASLTGEPTLAYNLGILAGLTLTPLAAYALVRWLTGSFGVALIAGAAFGFNPWHLERAAGHLTLTNLEGIPVLVLGLIMVRRGSTRRPWAPWAVLVAGLILTAYTNSYFALAIGIILTAFVAADIGRAVVARNRHRIVGAARRCGLVVAAVALVYVPQAIWLMTHRATIDADLAGTRFESDLYTYGARWWEWITPSYRHPAFGDEASAFLVPRLHDSNFGETSLYLGWTIIALAVLGLAVVALARWRRPTMGFPALLGALLILFGVITALPKTVTIAGIGLPTPSAFIWRIFDLWRVYSRMWVVVMLGAVMLAAVGLAWMWERLHSTGIRAIATAIIGALVMFDLAIADTTTFSTTPPPVYAALAQRGPGARIEYPLDPPTAASHYQYILYTASARRPLVNGAKSMTWSGSLQERLRNPRDTWVAPVLAGLGAPWVVVHELPYRAAGQAPPRSLPGMRLDQIVRTDRIYRVTARAARLFAWPGSGFSIAEPVGEERYEQWLLGTQGSISVHNGSTRALPATIAFEASSFGAPRKAAVNLDGRPVWNGTISVRPRRITMRVAVPPGDSQLGLRVQGPAQSLRAVLGVPDERVVSVRLGGVTASSPTTGSMRVG